MLPKAPIPFAPTPQLVVQYCTFHLAKVKCVADPEGRGRVQVEVPGLLGTGKENWTDWIEVSGNPLGGTKAEGDEGLWWPLQVGQIVMVGFLAGDPFALWCIPGPTVQEEKGRNKQWAPKEAKIAGKKKPREATRIRQLKTEAGHTLIFDDRGKKEKLALVDWTGAGLYIVGPGKKEDEEEQEDEESKPRKNERRGTRLVAAGTAKKPGEICRDGQAFLYQTDLGGQGVASVAGNGAGILALFSTKGFGEIASSIVLDAVNDRIYLTAGETQMQILGDAGHIAVTRQIIKEIPEKAPVEDLIKEIIAAVGKEWEELSPAEDSSDQGGGGDAPSGGGGGTLV
jgi:hypothetical protein